MINTVLTPGTTYYWKITDKFRNVYTGSVVADAEGRLTILVADLPAGIFTAYSGKFDLTIHSDLACGSIEFPLTARYQCIEIEARAGNSTKNNIGCAIEAPVTGFQEYVAALMQAGTGDPTANVINNTLGDVQWTRIGVGQYLGTLTGALPSGKVIGSSLVVPGVGSFYLQSRNNGDEVELFTYNAAGVLADDVLDGLWVQQIQVYP